MFPEESFCHCPELEDLPLPYMFDVEAYELLRHEPLREHIDRCGSLFYSH